MEAQVLFSFRQDSNIVHVENSSRSQVQPLELKYVTLLRRRRPSLAHKKAAAYLICQLARSGWGPSNHWIPEIARWIFYRRGHSPRLQLLQRFAIIEVKCRMGLTDRGCMVKKTPLATRLSTLYNLYSRPYVSVGFGFLFCF